MKGLKEAACCPRNSPKAFPRLGLPHKKQEHYRIFVAFFNFSSTLFVFRESLKGRHQITAEKLGISRSRMSSG